MLPAPQYTSMKFRGNRSNNIIFFHPNIRLWRPQSVCFLDHDCDATPVASTFHHFVLSREQTLSIVLIYLSIEILHMFLDKCHSVTCTDRKHSYFLIDSAKHTIHTLHYITLHYNYNSFYSVA